MDLDLLFTCPLFIAPAGRVSPALGLSLLSLRFGYSGRDEGPYDAIKKPPRLATEEAKTKGGACE